MSRAMALDRREFLRRTTRPRPSVDVSCERLYMQYTDARSEGRLEQFLHRWECALAEAGEVRLTRTEWLAHDGFRAAVGRLLQHRHG